MTLAKDVINSREKVINITGVPGAGKTKLIADIALSEPKKKMLYLSFGSENTKNAKTRMPTQVFCLSFHALAKKKMDISNDRLIDKLTMSEANRVAQSLGYPLDSAKMIEAFVILNDLFCMSGTDLIRIHDIMQRKISVFPTLSDDEKTIVLRTYKQYWSELWRADSTLKCTHDMYLKGYSLSACLLDIDYLFVDEMQDLNDTMYAILSRIDANNPDLVMVKLGDPCQQIFAFRGANNQFSREIFHFTLNQSYRFGEALAQLANNFMEQQGVSYFTPITGMAGETDILSNPGQKAIIQNVKGGWRPTFIARYNMTLWHALKKFALAGIPCCMAGGGRHETAFLKGLYDLYLGKKTSYARLKGTTYNRFFQHARVSHNTSDLLACKFIESLGVDGEQLFLTMQQHLTTAAKADVLLTTLHQAKGLEYQHVVMTDDFAKCWDKDRKQFSSVPREEAHIIYTAMTRAKKSLTLPYSWTGLNG